MGQMLPGRSEECRRTLRLLGVQIRRSRRQAYPCWFPWAHKPMAGCHQVDQVELTRQTALEAVVLHSIPMGLLPSFWASGLEQSFTCSAMA